ncbi:MAG: hypothetical protein QOE31_2550 [Solirubrobacteraceae bacterium]|jgi:hypothetical protein|nr:hypothetical protein [Solirubrobacteraceae bacterium]
MGADQRVEIIDRDAGQLDGHHVPLQVVECDGLAGHRLRPSEVRALVAPGMPSKSSTTLRASASTSSSALDSSDRATVPGCTCVRLASRESFSAYTSSRVTFKRSTPITVHETAHSV